MSLITTAKKAAWVLKKRPVYFLGLAGQYWRFGRTRMLQPLFFRNNDAIQLGQNVRLQKLGAIFAERPHAHLRVGDDTIIYEKAQIGAYAKSTIEIGQGCIIGEAKIISRKKITIGDRVVTSWNVFVQDFDPHPVDPELRRVQMLNMVENFKPSYRDARQAPPLDWNFPSEEISIGDDVWLGANCTVLKGAHIGSGCIVATGAVVTAGKYPDRSIIAGAPAKVIKRLDEAPTSSPQ